MVINTFCDPFTVNFCVDLYRAEPGLRYSSADTAELFVSNVVRVNECQEVKMPL